MVYPRRTIIHAITGSVAFALHQAERWMDLNEPPSASVSLVTTECSLRESAPTGSMKHTEKDIMMGEA